MRHDLLRHCQGRGIEIGPGMHPLQLDGRDLLYVDKPDPFPRAAGIRVIEDDAERLSTFVDGRLDFVASSHVLEHCKSPIRALTSWLRVLRQDGIIWAAVPLKDHCFDRDRAAVTFDHLVRCHELFEPEPHYREYLSKVDKLTGEDLENRIGYCLAHDSNIHYHAWDHAAWWEFFSRMEHGFRIMESVTLGHEMIWVLRKA